MCRLSMVGPEVGEGVIPPLVHPVKVPGELVRGDLAPRGGDAAMGVLHELHLGGHQHLPSLPGLLAPGAHDQGCDGVPVITLHRHIVAPHQVASPGEEGEAAVAPDAVTRHHAPEVTPRPGGHARGHEGVIPPNVPQDFSSGAFKHGHVII